MGKTMELNVMDWIAIYLAIIGALNWGLVGFFQFDLVMAIFGNMTMLSRIIYDLVGLAGVYVLFIAMKLCKKAE